MKPLVLYIIFLISVINATGQKTVYFEFTHPEKNIIYSVFDSIEFIDNRLNQEYVGIVQTGVKNKLVPIWLHKQLSDEIRALIDPAIKSVPKEPHTILINFRNFFINEPRGLFEFHAESYAKWDNEYWLVYRIDSAYRVKGENIRDKLRKKINQEVAGFINTAVHLDLSRRANTLPVSIEYISDIDKNEKMKLPVFNVNKPEKGIYYTYAEFKNNQPRVTAFYFAKNKNQLKKLFRVNAANEQGKPIPRDSVYAVYDGNDLWIAAEHEYALLNKRGQDFFFSATDYESNKIEEVALSTFFLGIAGGIVAAIPRKAMFEFRVNHINGKFILLRRAADRN